MGSIMELAELHLEGESESGFRFECIGGRAEGKPEGIG
jgi:hypothetical protein